MKKHIAAILIFPAFLLLATTSVSQETAKDKGKAKSKAKDQDAPPNKATPADYQRIANAGSFTGKVSMGTKTVSFKIDDTEYQKQLKIADKAKTPAEQKAARAKVEAQYASLKWALGKDFELELEKGATLQKLHLAATELFDKNGNPKAAKNAGPPYPASPEDFGGDYMTTIHFGGMRDGKPTVRSAIVNNKQW